MRRVSLADVARAAGVAKATASRALSQEHRDVGEATRARIQGIAADMGYQPSQVAQALRTGRFQVLGLLIPQAHPDWAELVLGATTEASRRGYDLLIRLPRSGVALSDQATGLSIDGVIAVAEDPAVPPAPDPPGAGSTGGGRTGAAPSARSCTVAPAAASAARPDRGAPSPTRSPGPGCDCCSNPGEPCSTAAASASSASRGTRPAAAGTATTASSPSTA